MIKWLLVIAVIALVYFLFIKKKPLGDTGTGSKQDKANDDDMVECSQCGTYITLKEALLRDGNYFCSNECLKA